MYVVFVKVITPLVVPMVVNMIVHVNNTLVFAIVMVQATVVLFVN